MRNWHTCAVFGVATLLLLPAFNALAWDSPAQERQLRDCLDTQSVEKCLEKITPPAVGGPYSPAMIEEILHRLETQRLQRQMYEERKVHQQERRNKLIDASKFTGRYVDFVEFDGMTFGCEKLQNEKACRHLEELKVMVATLEANGYTYDGFRRTFDPPTAAGKRLAGPPLLPQ